MRWFLGTTGLSRVPVPGPSDYTMTVAIDHVLSLKLGTDSQKTPSKREPATATGTYVHSDYSDHAMLVLAA